MEPIESASELFDCDYEFDPITFKVTIRKHPKIKDYCDKLSRRNIILLISSVYPHEEFDQEVKKREKSLYVQKELSLILSYALARHVDAQKDEIIIEWCKETLNKIKERKLKDIRPLDSLKDYEPVFIEPFNITREDAIKLDKYKFIKRDRLGEFCSDYLCVTGSYIDALKPIEELNWYSLLKVIQEKVKIKKVIKKMDDFIRHNNFDTEKNE